MPLASLALRALRATPLRDELTRQLGAPTGLLGHLTGWALQENNAELTRWVIAQLDPGPAHAVLEIGCGPGFGAREVLARCGGGSYDAVEPSEAMRRQATRRLRPHIEAGRARIHDGVAAKLPFPDTRFDRGFANNVVYFWDDPVVELTELRRVLVPEGRVALGIRPASGIPDEFREQFESVGHRTYEPDDLTTAFEAAGFTDIEVRTHDGGYAAILGTA